MNAGRSCRRVAVGSVVDVGVDLINGEEEARIREMWALDMWPQKWSSEDVDADVPIDRIDSIGKQIIVQPLLVR